MAHDSYEEGVEFANGGGQQLKQLVVVPKDRITALLASKPAELGSEGNPYKGTYNSVVFERHDSGLRVGICERDDGFELVAHGTAGESSHYSLHPNAVFERLDRQSKPDEERGPGVGDLVAWTYAGDWYIGKNFDPQTLAFIVEHADEYITVRRAEVEARVREEGKSND